MSFILDALKKSESERQQQTGAEFANVPTGSGEAHPYRWLWILALLLAFNFAALMIVLMRPDAGSGPPASVPETPAAAAPVEVPQPSFEDQVAAAKAVHAEREEAAASEPRPAARSAPVAQPAPSTTSPQVPSIYELLADGRLQIADLHLDIHVFSENRDDRFVFINMVKHGEGSQLPEGPVVREITPEGVVLDYQGTTFLLPRE